MRSSHLTNRRTLSRIPLMSMTCTSICHLTKDSTQSRQLKKPSPTSDRNNWRSLRSKQLIKINTKHSTNPNRQTLSWRTITMKWASNPRVLSAKASKVIKSPYKDRPAVLCQGISQRSQVWVARKCPNYQCKIWKIRLASIVWCLCQAQQRLTTTRGKLDRVGNKCSRNRDCTRCRHWLPIIHITQWHTTKQVSVQANFLRVGCHQKTNGQATQENSQRNARNKWDFNSTSHSATLDPRCLPIAAQPNSHSIRMPLFQWFHINSLRRNKSCHLQSCISQAARISSKWRRISCRPCSSNTNKSLQARLSKRRNHKDFRKFLNRFQRSRLT